MMVAIVSGLGCPRGSFKALDPLEGTSPDPLDANSWGSWYHDHLFSPIPYDKGWWIAVGAVSPSSCQVHAIVSMETNRLDPVQGAVFTEFPTVLGARLVTWFWDSPNGTSAPRTVRYKLTGSGTGVVRVQGHLETDCYGFPMGGLGIPDVSGDATSRGGGSATPNATGADAWLIDFTGVATQTLHPPDIDYANAGASGSASWDYVTHTASMTASIPPIKTLDNHATWQYTLDEAVEHEDSDGIELLRVGSFVECRAHASASLKGCLSEFSEGLSFGWMYSVTSAQASATITNIRHEYLDPLLQ